MIIKIFITTVTLLFSTYSIYASFPIKKEKVSSSDTIYSEIALTEMESITIASIAGPSIKSISINSPRKDKWGFTKSIVKAFKQKNSKSAIWGILSVSCAVLGLFVAPILLGLIAFTFGVIGFNRKLKGLAITGLVLGVADVFLGLFLLLLAFVVVG